jgi:hypothetical protein
MKALLESLFELLLFLGINLATICVLCFGLCVDIGDHSKGTVCPNERRHIQVVDSHNLSYTVKCLVVYNQHDKAAGDHCH